MATVLYVIVLLFMLCCVIYEVKLSTKCMLQSRLSVQLAHSLGVCAVCVSRRYALYPPRGVDWSASPSPVTSRPRTLTDSSAPLSTARTLTRRLSCLHLAPLCTCECSIISHLFLTSLNVRLKRDFRHIVVLASFAFTDQ
ncbi:hypothetical protein RB195_020000 [Necator americanus]|uniref:Secreted protein n=1 Tax=Necator americanus TaxID=51031 RepID=A0ABR1CGR2_NECAM